MARALWWQCSSGIAGDMAVGSLVDAGADLDRVVEGLRALGVPGWSLSAEHVTRAGVAATHLQVEVEEPGEPRDWARIRELLEGAHGLPERARERALAVFAALAAAEATVHRQRVDDVHFHEVGALDAIVDIVGTCLALELLDVSSVHAGPVALGYGTVRSAHGELPNPAPAVVALLAGKPVFGRDEPVELTTPTGAAILAALARSFGPVPAMALELSGYGAGTRDGPGRPNVLQALLGQVVEHQEGQVAGVPSAQEDLVVVEANLDDVSGEVLGYLVPALLAVGALDAWLVPAIGKKGRPVQVVNALVTPDDAGRVAAVMFEEGGTLGVRRHQVERTALARHWAGVEVDGRPVRVKVGPHRAKPEYEDCVEVARATGRPLAEVVRLAEAAITVAGGRGTGLAAEEGQRPN